jgi:hypothetical protein
MLHFSGPSRPVPAQGGDRRDNLGDVTPADESLFAIYQPVHRRCVLTNPFDRTNIAICIRRISDKCEDYMALVERLYRGGLMDRDSYIERTNETAWDLLLHRTALSRLGEIGAY